MTCQWLRKELTKRKVPSQPGLMEIASQKQIALVLIFDLIPNKSQCAFTLYYEGKLESAAEEGWEEEDRKKDQRGFT